MEAYEAKLMSQDGSKIYYPHTVSDVVRDNNTGKTVKEQIDDLFSQMYPIENDTLISVLIDSHGKILDSISIDGSKHHYTKHVFYDDVEIKGNISSKSMNDYIALQIANALKPLKTIIDLGISFDAENNTLTLGGKSFVLIENADIIDYSEYLLERYSLESEEYGYVITDANNKILYSESVSGEIFKPRIDDEEIADVVGYYITHRGVEA